MQMRAVLAALTLMASPAVATELASGIGSAEYFGGHVALSMVQSPTDATVTVYDYNRGTVGQILGQSNIHAGTNANVAILLTQSGTAPVIAVLTDPDGRVLGDHVLMRADRQAPIGQLLGY